jgi:DNA-binding CsgD family transcriptional regulator
VSLADILTPRQLDIARCIAQGLTLKEIAAELGIAVVAVKGYCYADDGIFNRLGVTKSVQVARMVWDEQATRTGTEDLLVLMIKTLLTDDERQRVLAKVATMNEPTEKPKDPRGWQVREGATHWIPEAIPATTSPDNRAWTDYRDDDCQLRRHQPDGCNGSQRVRVASPLFPGARVRVKACEGGWEAVKDG